MKPHMRDKKTGLEYELTGDYYLLAGDDDPPPCPMGISGWAT